MKSDDRREPLFDAAESQTPSMSGSSVCGNRETPATSSAGGGEERSDKAHRRTADMHVTGESDGPIVVREAGEQSRPDGGGSPANAAGLPGGYLRSSLPPAAGSPAKGSRRNKLVNWVARPERAWLA